MTPSIAWESVAGHWWKSKMRADSACGRKEPASLSIVTVPPGSSASGR
jgi:hypothetical protein